MNRRTHYRFRSIFGAPVAACGERNTDNITDDVKKVDCKRCARTVANEMIGVKTPTPIPTLRWAYYMKGKSNAKA